MKTIVLIILMCFTQINCTKDKINKSRYWGNFSAKLNNINWNGYVLAANYSNDTSTIEIIVEKYKNSVIRESLSIIKIPKINMRNRVFKKVFDRHRDSVQARYITITSEGDVFCDIYNIKDEDANNELIIESFDPQTKEIKGRFQYLKFYLQSYPKCNPNAPDSILFTNGSFHTKVLF